MTTEEKKFYISVNKVIGMGPMRSFILTTFPEIINLLQLLRNETTHGDARRLKRVKRFRKRQSVSG